jgi:nucleotide-binding universal stress UspA family protein
MTGVAQAKPPYRHVIVATDGSRLSGTALQGGSLLAAKTSAELHVFHAASSLDSEALAAGQAVELLGGRSYKLVVKDLVGGASPAQMITGYATEVGEEVIVAVGTHGRGGVGVSLLGSTAVDLVARASQPILAYGPGADHPMDIERVVACVDGSQFSELALAEATRWAAALDVPLWLIQVVPRDLPPEATAIESTYVHNLAKELKGLVNQIEWDVLHSMPPARSILEWYGNDAATMLVMATHGRVGLRRVLVGSVASDVVRGAWGPVALIRPPE